MLRRLLPREAEKSRNSLVRTPAKRLARGGERKMSDRGIVAQREHVLQKGLRIRIL